jgi:hypothetical protein
MVRENQAQVLRETGVLARGLFPGWKNRDGTGLIFRLMQRLGKPFFQFIRGAASVGGEPSPGNSRRPDSDLLSSPCPLPPARITDDAAAKLSDLPSIAPNPEDRTVNYFRLPLQLGVIWMVERGLINGNRRQSGNRQREPECVS